ncbi:MAG TPA: hypothetical protein VN408_30365 [Actinoplanes sp.]|nr:hypothetical protein [Actinoplanes sp.]
MPVLAVANVETPQRAAACADTPAPTAPINPLIPVVTFVMSAV